MTVKIFNRGSSEVGQVGQGGGNLASANGVDKLSEGIKIRGEKELEIVIGRLKNLWSLRQSCKVEGKRFRIGDMTISIGTITIGNHLHNGILLMYLICYTCVIDFMTLSGVVEYSSLI